MSGCDSVKNLDKQGQAVLSHRSAGNWSQSQRCLSSAPDSSEVSSSEKPFPTTSSGLFALDSIPPASGAWLQQRACRLLWMLLMGLSVSLTHSVSCTHRAWTASSRLRAWRMDLIHTHPRGVFEEWILDFRLWGSFPPGLSRGRSLANELKPERTAGNNKKSPKFRKPRQQSQMSWSHWFFFS